MRCYTQYYSATGTRGIYHFTCPKGELPEAKHSQMCMYIPQLIQTRSELRGEINK